MNLIEDGELSALLDGELDFGRAEVVRAAINADPALRQEFDTLCRLDARLRGAADVAAFLPDVSFTAAERRELPAWYWPTAAAVVATLIVARFLPKFAELPLLGIGLHVAGCAAILVIVVRMVREAETLEALAPGIGIRT